jgi:hypothetical protein
MTKYVTAFIFATALSASACADSIYHRLAKGNQDLNNGQGFQPVLGVQPGVGTSFDVYRGLAKGNPDLFQRRESTGSTGPRPDIYQGLGRNPDLSY